jgi:Flp pilus assembly protein TadG
MKDLSLSQRIPLHTVRRRCSVSRRPGNAIIEAALVLPVLLALAFGTIEFGHFFFCKHTFQGAARDGARVAILSSSTNTSVTTAVANTMTAAGFTAGQYTVAITNTSNVAIADIRTITTGNPIKVSVTATWGTIGIRPMNMISASKQVTGFMIMVKE